MEQIEQIQMEKIQVKILDNIRAEQTSIFFWRNIEFEILPNTIVRLELQIIFYKNNTQYKLDIIDVAHQDILYNGVKLDWKYKDENCPLNKFLQFHSTIGVDIQKIIDTTYDNWELEQKNLGYFEKMIIEHFEIGLNNQTEKFS